MLVLQVEDDAETAKAVELMLDAEGHACDTVGNGVAAIERVRRQDYDLVLLDLMLPDLEGYEVLRQMQAADFSAPVLVQTGLIGRDQKVEGMSLGVREFLVKPFDSRELTARIESAIKLHGEVNSAGAAKAEASDQGHESQPEGQVPRRAKRTRTLKSGQIIYNHASCVIDCVIKDISESGARLVVPDMFECPPNVTLRILHGPTYECKVRWQSGKSLGVEFVQD